ncbi:hypothetical protein BB561_003788 [Smittium simulii]|uniref:Uncharacterized protein n=1 Tax=Smittium simulii TaxID=133385 RepID=A0A2T9YJH5_9FUNG|nr:hypothetical protein BB561_003788 [Smittium simulii]
MNINNLFRKIINSYLQGSEIKNVKKKLTEGEIISNLKIEDFKPTIALNLTYGDKKIELGSELIWDSYVKQMLSTQPTVSYKVANVSLALFTLAMIDIDTPTQKDAFYSQFRHMLLTNIPQEDVAKASEPHTSPYIPLSQPAGCGKKRYVILLAKQKQEYDKAPMDSNTLFKFDVIKFFKDNDMTLVGVTYFTVVGPPAKFCAVSNPKTI